MNNAISSREIQARIGRARTETKGLKVQGLMVTDLVHVRYLSGFTGSEATLLITPRGQSLLTDSRYTTQAKAEAREYKIVQVAVKIKELAELVRALGVKRLGFEPEGMTHARFLEFKRELKGVQLIALCDELRRLRVIKSETEAGRIAQAARIAHRAFQETLPLVRPGMREREFALALEVRMRELGSGPPPFPTIVASGPRGALPHGTASNRIMKMGELVTVDFGAKVEGYQSDQTITFCMGRASAKQKLIYETVREAQAKALLALRPGAIAKDVDARAREHLAKKGFGKYFGHGLGHGVGLMTHEEPVLNAHSKTILKQGMVVTVEPGVYIPGFGGVRIEDMALITAGGFKKLTASGGPLREIMI